MKMIIYILMSLLLSFLSVNVYASFVLGVGTHIHEQDLDRNIKIIKDIGLNSIRDDLNWRGVEKEKGKYIIPEKLNLYLDKTKKSNIKPLIVLFNNNYNIYDKAAKPFTAKGIQAFAEFTRFSAKEFAGRVDFIEIWNEWDIGAEPKTVESYFELVKVTAPAIKAVNTNAVVLAGVSSTDAMQNGWVAKLVHMGVLNHVDGVSIHPYIHCDLDTRPEAWFNYVSDFSDKLQKANGGKEVPLYITEMGWPSHNGACSTPPEKVAQYLARALLLIRTLPAVKGFWWYDLKNDGLKNEEIEHNFGLLGYDYSPKPAFAALRDITPFIIDGENFSRVKAPFGLVMIAVTDSTGNKSIAVWTESGNKAVVDVSIIRNAKSHVAILKIGGTKFDQIPPAKSNLTLTIDGMPLVVNGANSLTVNKVTW